MTGRRDDKREAERGSGSNSYLVRVWREGGSEAKVRFYLRDLKSGEERYLGDPDRLGAVLMGDLEGLENGAYRSRETG